MSVVLSRGVFAFQGLLKYSSLWRNGRDFKN